MRVPAEMNSRALNRAWVNRWNVASVGILRAMVAIIKPSCLSVERAIIFFKSFSAIADVPAINMVVVAVRSKAGLIRGRCCRVGKNRISKKTPAVTRVEE